MRAVAANTRRVPREASVQRDIELAIGALPGVLLLRNNVGVVERVRDDGRGYRMPYGLGVGSPDLVVILGPHGRVVGLEVKRPGEKPTAEQLECHARWRMYGAHVAVVRGVGDALKAIEEAREM